MFNKFLFWVLSAFDNRTAWQTLQDEHNVRNYNALFSSHQVRVGDRGGIVVIPTENNDA